MLSVLWLIVKVHFFSPWRTWLEWSENTSSSPLLCLTTNPSSFSPPVSRVIFCSARVEMKMLASGSGTFLWRKTSVFVFCFPSPCTWVGTYVCWNVKCVCLTAAAAGSSGGEGSLCQLSNYVWRLHVWPLSKSSQYSHKYTDTHRPQHTQVLCYRAVMLPAMVEPLHSPLQHKSMSITSPEHIRHLPFYS